MSATVVETTTVEQSTRDKDRLFHFACSLVRLRTHMTGEPVRCLCGKVQSGGVGSTKRAPNALRCVVCLELSRPHLAECSPCRTWSR